MIWSLIGDYNCCEVQNNLTLSIHIDYTNVTYVFAWVLSGAKNEAVKWIALLTQQY